ncbi:hypothetical protein [Natrononativus amylolyticus]|uniref:hypothetical protein n=1 Tax=Natrononativus amylolyticus TaxID=2963434 RepID=UPI0020CCB152|nr:hypothetical protein [Natrononativus amylolyticus]
MSKPRTAIRLYRDGGLLSLSRRTATKLVWEQPSFSSLPPRAVWAAYEFRCRFLPDVSDANPLRLRWVDPDEIEYYHGDGPSTFGAVRAGEWDRPASRFTETEPFRSLEMHFADGVDWEETPLYREYANRLGTSDPYWRCRSPEELRAYFSGIDSLYDRIRREGYRTQRDLLRERGGAVRENASDAPHPLLEEICVNVYRDGTLAKKRCGNHRLSIAKLLDLEEIPVVVLVRHERWQRLRDEVRAADSPAALSARATRSLSHPDLTDVRPVG